MKNYYYKNILLTIKKKNRKKPTSLKFIKVTVTSAMEYFV